jgi:dihydropteridine reductase
MTQAGRVVVYGGRGALGSKCISTLKANNFWVGSIDLTENSDADLNIVLEKDSDLAQQESKVLAWFRRDAYRLITAVVW